ncbi:YIP1 family protein [Staphylococcus arlettae]|uniref:YIP1 family protein n=1 Tax=Staphylococcus arlettae TaxID=29378 RepID=UPI0021D36BD0|nr:YIP1 family protein [Staphylococcus arlettae]UXU51190.1 YIP1 family protein [Staphylococcus arlettae]
MNDSKLPLVNHFSNLRDSPKWGLKLLITIILTSLSSIISVYTTDWESMYKYSGLSESQIEQTISITKMSSIIGSPFVSLITILITFLMFLLISKLMKSNASAKVVFSATTSYTLITGGISLIILLIQWGTGLSPEDYNIASLNIFDKGNAILGVFNLQTILGAYIFGIMLFSTNQLSKRASIIWSILYIIIFIIFGLIGASFQN